ncbi:hypothetical protein N2152v2_001651 [Parachlorella kessleri]
MRAELSLLCLLLTFGIAVAEVGSFTLEDSSVSVKLDVVDAEVDLLSRRYGFAGEVNHGRGLLQTYPPVITGTVTPTVNPGDFCANYGGAASQQPNSAFRQALQSIGSNAGSFCGVAPPNNGKYIRQISTKCQRGSNSFADAIKVSFQTLPISDNAKNACFSSRLNTLLTNGAYACLVKSFLPDGFKQW